MNGFDKEAQEIHDHKDTVGQAIKPLMPNVIAGVMLTISLTFSTFYSLANNYSIAGFSMLISFGIFLSAIAWGLFTWMNKMGQRNDQRPPED